MNKEEKFRDRLLEEIGPIFNQYIMNGDLSVTPFTKQIDMNIDDLDTLLKIHFLMPYKTNNRENNKLDVIDFMKNLEKRIRRINTSIKKEKEKYQGGNLKGKIDFSRTFKERLMHNPFDETMFICNLIDKDFNTDENKVLKTFLEILWEILNSDKIKSILEYDYLYEHWIKERDVEGDRTSFKEILERILEMNIYLRNIDIKNETVIEDERLLNDVSKSRNSLYREAAELLIRYKDVIINRDIDDSEARELLKHTFIKPKKNDVLFELYWTLRIVDEFNETKPRFKPIQTGKNIIAYWETDEYEYKIYHNSSGSKNIGIKFREDYSIILDKLKNSNFRINGKKIMDTFIGRELKIMEHFNEMGDQIKLWHGNQPDIIFEKKLKDTGEIEDIFIGEVKYSDDEYYDAKNGMKELLEYISLIGKDEYYETSNNLFQNLAKTKGALFVKEKAKVGKITDTVSDNIKIIHFDNREEWDSLRTMLGLS